MSESRTTQTLIESAYTIDNLELRTSQTILEAAYSIDDLTLRASQTLMEVLIQVPSSGSRRIILTRSLD